MKDRPLTARANQPSAASRPSNNPKTRPSITERALTSVRTGGGRGGMLDEELAAAPHTALQGDQGSLTLAAGWPMASPVFNQGRNYTANPGEKRFRARSEQAGIAVK